MRRITSTPSPTWSEGILRLLTTLVLVCAAFAVYAVSPQLRASPRQYALILFAFFLITVTAHRRVAGHIQATLHSFREAVSGWKSLLSLQRTTSLAMDALKSQRDVLQESLRLTEALLAQERELLDGIRRVQSSLDSNLAVRSPEEALDIGRWFQKQEGMIARIQETLNSLSAGVMPPAFSQYWASWTALEAKRNALMHQHPRIMTEFLREASHETIGILAAHAMSSALLGRAFSDYGFRVNLILYSPERMTDLSQELQHLTKQKAHILLVDEWSAQVPSFDSLEKMLRRRTGHMPLIIMFDVLARQPEKLRETLHHILERRPPDIAEHFLDEIQVAALYTSLIRTTLKR